MKKIGLVLIFIFLTGLFSGIFFSTNISNESNQTLSSFLMSGMSPTDSGFFEIFAGSFLSNALLFLIMMPAAFTAILRPVPFLILWYKSFAIGFCSGLVYINYEENAFAISLIKLFPQNLFFIPAFILFTAAIIKFHSIDRRDIGLKLGRNLNISASAVIFAAAVILLTIGAAAEAGFHQVAL